VEVGAILIQARDVNQHRNLVVNVWGILNEVREDEIALPPGVAQAVTVRDVKVWEEDAHLKLALPNHSMI
jgi:hypothetical protein